MDGCGSVRDEEGDELWFFGFSRGAFTARSLVGLIRNVGLLHAPVDEEVLQRAYDLYRRRDEGPDTEDARAFRARENAIPIERLNIAFLGAWDTVGALGIPGLLTGRMRSPDTAAAKAARRSGARRARGRG